MSLAKNLTWKTIILSCPSPFFFQIDEVLSNRARFTEADNFQQLGTIIKHSRLSSNPVPAEHYGTAYASTWGAEVGES